MATVEASKKKVVSNAFDSPSIIKFSKDPKDIKGYNPAASPSCKVNGGAKTDSTVDITKSPSIKMLQRAGTESVDALKSPAVKFLGISESKVKNAMTSPSLQVTSESKVSLCACSCCYGCRCRCRCRC